MLPFRTMQEAEHSLGRPLTCAERIWFRYSAQTHDLWLYCHTTLLLCLVYTLVPLPLALLEMRRVSWLHEYKLQPKVQLSSVAFFKCYRDVIRTLLLAVGPLQFISYPAFKCVGIRTGLPLACWWEILLQIGVYFLIEDYVNYWVHRMMHCKWVYEKIHRVHHEFTAPMGFAAYYAHWSEILILGLPSLVGPALVPGHIITFWLWMVLRQIEIIHTHCGYDLPLSPTKYIPFYAGAEFHDYHHYIGGRSQSNFGSIFTYCDYIYGTNKGYRYQKLLLRKLRRQYIRGEQHGE